MNDDRQMPLLGAATDPLAAERTFALDRLDLKHFGALVSAVATSDGATFRFEHGTLETTPAQFFDLSRILSRKMNL